MKKTVAIVLVVSLVVLTSLAVTRGQVLSMAASAIQQKSPIETNSAFNSDRVQDLGLAEPFSVLAAGDIANCETGGSFNRAVRNLQYSLSIARQVLVPNDGMVVTTNLLKSFPDAPVLALGDLAYGRGEPAAFNDCYDPFWGVAKARTWPTPGNHEYGSPGAYGYFDYWQERAGPDREGYYALQSTNWLIFSLNSEIDASPGSPQARWIRTVLDANPDRCIGAFYHKPAFSSVARNNSDEARALFQMMAKAGAVFVLNGHNHFYERSQPLDETGKPSERGTINFVVGAGGKVTNGRIEPANFVDRLITGEPGVLKLDFSTTSVDWTYLTANDSNASDSGSISCAGRWYESSAARLN